MLNDPPETLIVGQRLQITARITGGGSQSRIFGSRCSSDLNSLLDQETENTETAPPR